KLAGFDGVLAGLLDGHCAAVPQLDDEVFCVAVGLAVRCASASAERESERLQKDAPEDRSTGNRATTQAGHKVFSGLVRQSRNVCRVKLCFARPIVDARLVGDAPAALQIDIPELGGSEEHGLVVGLSLALSEGLP